MFEFVFHVHLNFDAHSVSIVGRLNFTPPSNSLGGLKIFELQGVRIAEIRVSGVGGFSRELKILISRSSNNTSSN